MNSMIIAHRGESFDAPENTLASVNLAWERNAEAVEIDVRLSKDNRVIVFHDRRTLRIGNKNKKVKNQTLDELKQLDVGSWKSEKFKNEKIPTLKEVFQTVPKYKKIIVEIKSSIKIIPYVVSEINTSNLTNDQIEIISFKYDVISAIKKELPHIKALYLADLDYTWMTKVFSPTVKQLIEKAKEANLDGLNVWAGKMLTEKFCYEVKWAGLLLYCWTVDNPNHAKQLANWGIDGITTNRAEWLTNQL